MSMRAQCDAIPHYWDDAHPEDEANWDEADSPGQRLRQWRHGHGYTSEEAGALFGRTGAAVRQWERRRYTVPAAVLAYTWHHPVPTTQTEYPPTPEGLRRAISRWPTQAAWCRWWGPTVYPTLHRWLQGKLPIPRSLQVWLCVGAPLSWRGRPTPPKLRPPSPVARRTRVPFDWIALGNGRVAPPAGYCDPERDALRLPGCAWCCYRSECQDLQGERP